MLLKNEDYFLPTKAERKLARLFRQSPALQQNGQFQQQIVNWAKEMLAESRAEWEDMRTTTVNAAISCNKKAEATKRGMLRDKKYAPFRRYFATVQQQKFLEYQKSGLRLSANGFAIWFLKHKSRDIDIPYKESNHLHKLIQLAEENNRILKKQR